MNSSPSSSSIPDFLVEIAAMGSADELAWHLLDASLMHDPDCEELVRRASLGEGEHSQLLQAIVGDAGGSDWEPVTVDKPPAPPPKPINPFESTPVWVRREVNGRRIWVLHEPKKNPFALVKAVQRTMSRSAQPYQRSAVLEDEAVRLYRCIAFAMRTYGVVMNGHMTVLWERLGIHDHVQAAAILTDFNHRMRKWLMVDANGRKRKGISATAYGPSELYFYAFIHEHVPQRGFHTHQLIGVTDGKCKAFAEYAVKVLQGLTKVSKVPADAVVFTPATKRDGFSPYMPRFKNKEMERCWIWFRYLAKNLSPHAFMQVGNQCANQRDIFRIRRVFMEPLPVTCRDLFGCSQNIAIGAQNKAGFVSKFDSGDWKDLYSGSELTEYRFEIQREEQERENLAFLAALKI